MSKRLIAVLCLLLMLTGCATPGTSSSSEPHSQIVQPKEQRFTDSIKVLAIGNSYTQNAITYLYPILENMGVKQIVVANLFIGGCDLGTHMENAQKDTAAYTYYKVQDGEMVKAAAPYTVKQGLADEDWDIIVLNQASQKAGQDMTYLKLDDLCAYVNEHKTNPDAELWWHMTWAYHPQNPHDGFAYYDNDQQTMYDKIVETVQGSVLPLSEIAGVIPCGTAFQNARGMMGNGLSDTDLHHANAAGCYLLGLTWAAALTNIDPKTVTWLPDEVTASTLGIFQTSADNAIDSPFSVTES